VALGSRIRETAYLCRLGRHDLVACPSLWVSVSHNDGTGEIMTSEVRRIGGLRPPTEVTGPLAEYAAAFKQMLIGQGYARGTISAHLGLMSQVSRWLDVQGLPARALADLGEVDRFFAERRAKGCRLRITARSLVPLLDFLRDRHSAIGRRDYAIVLLLTRLGLRASEVAGSSRPSRPCRYRCRTPGPGTAAHRSPLPRPRLSFPGLLTCGQVPPGDPGGKRKKLTRVLEATMNGPSGKPDPSARL
jgi:hypothetical protein